MNKKRFSRSTLLYIPPEDLVLITDKNHYLYSPSAELPYDEDLVISIMLHGVLAPILVSKDGSQYEVILGRRRVKAAIEANIRLTGEGKMPIYVPSVIRCGGKSEEVKEIIATENKFNAGISHVSKANMASRLKKEGHSMRKIAEMFGTSRQNIENMLVIDSMPSEIKEAINEGKITSTCALALKSLPPDEQVSALNYIVTSNKNLTVGFIKDAVRTRAFESLPPSED